MYRLFVPVRKEREKGRGIGDRIVSINIGVQLLNFHLRGNDPWEDAVYRAINSSWWPSS